MNIELGDKVKDKVTGFTGIVIAMTEYLQGCNRATVQSKTLKDGIPTEPQAFDEPQLTVVKKNVVDGGDKDTGGVAYAQPEPKSF